VFGDGQSPVVGLRVDVDTLRGTRHGVPELLNVFSRRGIQASFFFSVGPDNMGRHLRRLVRPKFLLKMIRSKAPGLYGWDILLRGTIWPGPNIGKDCAPVMRAAAALGHEVGIHAWDHHKWQTRLEKMSAAELAEETISGVETLARILGTDPNCSAAAGWRCNPAALAVKQKFGMTYHSDCRGVSIFRPIVDGAILTPQIPVTLPTYDELVGRDGISDANYNTTLLDQIEAGRLNVLTIHAEVEGIGKLALFQSFLDEAEKRGLSFVPLVDLLPPIEEIPLGSIAEGSVAGRDGVLCVQAEA
jgi:undecaprenyl phosphate-alpha-L-ara4FN deformylase